MAKKQSRSKGFIRLVFIVYCGIMIWLLFFRSGGWVPGLTYEEQLRNNINLDPFYTIRNYLRVVIHRTNDALLMHCIINLLGNIVLFVPVGYLMPRIWNKLHNYFRFFVACAGIIFLVEILQLFTLLGSFDVDDLILNLLGMTLGFIGYHLFGRK